ncbi:hypothetical protein T439DRAFT_323140 [Meredithblackwellia eburnea MCA 4105]
MVRLWPQTQALERGAVMIHLGAEQSAVFFLPALQRGITIVQTATMIPVEYNSAREGYQLAGEFKFQVELLFHAPLPDLGEWDKFYNYLPNLWTFDPELEVTQWDKDQILLNIYSMFEKNVEVLTKMLGYKTCAKVTCQILRTSESIEPFFEVEVNKIQSVVPRPPLPTYAFPSLPEVEGVWDVFKQGYRPDFSDLGTTGQGETKEVLQVYYCIACKPKNTLLEPMEGGSQDREIAYPIVFVEH